MSALTPDELRELRRLHVQLGRRVDSMFAGDYRAAVRGQGMEFEEVRSYFPGDDVRRIDWNVTARTGEPFVKVFREERQLTLVLAVDVSGSMRVGSGGRNGRTDKRLQTARVAGGLAFAGVRNRDRVGLVLFSSQIEEYLSPRSSRGHTWAVIQKVYEASGQHPGTDLRGALGFLAQVQRRRAVIVLVSDFLDDGAWLKVLGPVARRHQVHAIVVHDPLEEGLRNLGLLQVQDAESGRRQVIDARASGPVTPVDDRVKALRRAGCRAVALSTDDDPFQVLHRHFQAEGARR